MATNFSRSLDINIPQVQGGASGGYGAAAGMTDLAGTFNAQREKAPKFERFGAQNIMNRAAEENAVTAATGDVMATGIGALASVKSNRLLADAQVEAANKVASAQKSAAGMGAIGSVIGAGLSLFSDESTKRDIKQLDDALTMLRDLRPVSFYYKDEYTKHSDRKHHGFIAQEFRNVLPDATYQDEKIGKLCIDTIDVIGLLVRSVQQLEERVMYLEVQKALAGVK